MGKYRIHYFAVSHHFYIKKNQTMCQLLFSWGNIVDSNRVDNKWFRGHCRLTDNLDLDTILHMAEYVNFQDLGNIDDKEKRYRGLNIHRCK